MTPDETDSKVAEKVKASIIVDGEELVIEQVMPDDESEAGSSAPGSNPGNVDEEDKNTLDDRANISKDAENLVIDESIGEKKAKTPGMDGKLIKGKAKQLNTTQIVNPGKIVAMSAYTSLKGGKIAKPENKPLSQSAGASKVRPSVGRDEDGSGDASTSKKRKNVDSEDIDQPVPKKSSVSLHRPSFSFIKKQEIISSHM